MGFWPHLAMTAAEIAGCPQLPDRLAYMACHFSPYSTGLSNLPEQLPAGSLLIVNDRTPVCGHDPQLIVQQLQHAVEALDCCGMLLDFQRPGFGETARVASAIAENMACPVAVTPCYAQGLDCAVCLPPPPLRQPLEKYLQQWPGREIWLEAALDGETVTVTRDGCQVAPLEVWEPGQVFLEDGLFCQYYIKVYADRICFHVQRTPPLLDGLLDRARALGVTRAVGLYQQLQDAGRFDLEPFHTDETDPESGDP